MEHTNILKVKRNKKNCNRLISGSLFIIFHQIILYSNSSMLITTLWLQIPHTRNKYLKTVTLNYKRKCFMFAKYFFSLFCCLAWVSTQLTRSIELHIASCTFSWNKFCIFVNEFLCWPFFTEIFSPSPNRTTFLYAGLNRSTCVHITL